MPASRTVTRSLRIPQEIDDQVLEHKTKDEEPNLTQAYIGLISLGLEVVSQEKKIRENPLNAEQIKAEYEKNIRPLLCLFNWESAFQQIPDDYLETALIRTFKEYIKRRRERKLEEAQLGTVREFGSRVTGV